MAQFVVIGMDGSDAEAMNRRLAVREAHLAYTEPARESGMVKLAVALKDESGEKMIGSFLLFDVESKADIDAYLEKEPYISGNVWQEIKVYPAAVGPTFTI